MWHRRTAVVFILLVLILLGASILFGLLTYWLSAEVLPAFSPDQGRPVPEREGDRSSRCGPTGRETPLKAPSLPARGGF